MRSLFAALAVVALLAVAPAAAADEGRTRPPDHPVPVLPCFVAPCPPA